MREFTLKEKLMRTPLYKKLYLPLQTVVRKKQILKDPVRFIKKEYRKVMGRSVDLDNPETYTEKMQWWKANVTAPIYTRCANKVAVRKYVADTLKKHGIEDGILNFPKWIGVYSRAEDIDFAALPNEFVLKSNHASGHIIICTDKKKLNWKKTVRTLKQWLRTNFYFFEAEPQYRRIRPRIICEKFLEDNIVDYRIFCFKGKPFFTKVTQHNNATIGGYDESTYDPEWNKVDIVWTKAYGSLDFPKPEGLKDMMRIAEALSSDFPFVRVDLYSCRGKIYFGELTFTPNSGFEPDLSDEWNQKLGQLWGGMEVYEE